MSRAPILPLALMLALPACDDGQQEGRPPRPPSPAPLATEPAAGAAEYLALPEAGKVEVVGSCQFEGPDGPVLRADLANGGSLQLRKLPEGILHVSALPSPGADPVGTRVPSDTTWSEEGGFVNGSSVLWLEDTENRIVVEFRVRWDDSVAACPEPATPAAVPTPLTNLEQGGTYWGVYLAVGEEPDLEDAIAYLNEQRGIAFSGFGSVDCDEGARKALPRGAGPYTVALYFATEGDARAWAETLPAAPVAIAEVRTFCLD